MVGLANGDHGERGCVRREVSFLNSQPFGELYYLDPAIINGIILFIPLLSCILRPCSKKDFEEEWMDDEQYVV